jgi:hypothetical protein
MAMSREKFEELMNAAKQRAAYVESLANGPAVPREFPACWGGAGRVLVTPCLVRKGGWRVTFIGYDGIVNGHKQELDYPTAIREARAEGAVMLPPG